MQGRETTQVTLNKKQSFNLTHGISWIPRARTSGWPLEELKPGLSLPFWYFMKFNLSLSRHLISPSWRATRPPSSRAHHQLIKVSVSNPNFSRVNLIGLSIVFPYIKWYCQLSPEARASESATMTKESTLVGLGREAVLREAAHEMNRQIGQHSKTPPHWNLTALTFSTI